MLSERNQSQKFVLYDYISMTFSKEQNYKEKEQICGARSYEYG